MPVSTPRPSRSVRVALGAAALSLLGLVVAPAAFALPTLEVPATENLKSGQTITVTGSGFAPNLKGIAVGQCRTGFSGPADCNLQGGATFRNADAKGVIEPVTIKLAETFGDVDCMAEQCVIAAQPLPTTSGPEEVAANTVIIPIYFNGPAPADAGSGASAPPSPAPAEEAPAAPAPVVQTAGVSSPVLTGSGSGMAGVGLGLAIGALGGAGAVMAFHRKAGAR